MPNIAYLSLYDCDGALMKRPYFNKASQAYQQLIENNSLLFQYQKNLIKQHVFSKIIIASGSNRQDAVTDISNGNINNNGSSTPAFLLAQQHLQTFTTSSVVLDLIWLVDICENKIPGYNYRKVLKKISDIYNSNDNNEIAFNNRQLFRNEFKSFFGSVFDEWKIILIYIHLYRALLLNPDIDHFIVDFFDDRFDILEKLTLFYSNYSDLIHKKIIFNLHLYNGDQLKHYSTIQGTGNIIDHYYYQIVHYFTEHQQNLDQEKIKSRPRIKYHDDIPACAPIVNDFPYLAKKLNFEWNDDILISAFKAYRSSNLASPIPIEDKFAIPNYTTTPELRAEGIALPKFSLSDDYVSPLQKIAFQFNTHPQSSLSFFKPKLQCFITHTITELEEEMRSPSRNIASLMASFIYPGIQEEFYQLVKFLNQLITDEERYLAINQFCARYGLNEITPPRPLLALEVK